MRSFGSTAKIPDGKFTSCPLKNVTFCKCCSSSEGRVRLGVAGAGIAGTEVPDVQPEIPPVLVGDPLRLQQIVLNLVGNAIKFTPSGQVSFRLLLADRSENDVVLHGAVRDTGIGIPPEKQQSIFQAFGQIHSSRSCKEAGTGLGLAITSRLVELMAGRLRVESTPRVSVGPPRASTPRRQ